MQLNLAIDCTCSHARVARIGAGALALFAFACAGCSSRKPSEPPAKAVAADARLPTAGVLPVALERVSVANDGQETTACHGTRPACKNNSHPAISADGSRVVFDSDAENVVAAFPNPKNVAQIYWRDVATQTTQILSLGISNGLPALGDGASSFAEISGDGAWVVFGSQASNLDPDDGNATDDIFVCSIASGVIQRLSENQGGADWDGGTNEPQITDEGRWVVFSSTATNFDSLRRPGSSAPVRPPSTAFQNIFVKDRENGVVEWISAPVVGEPDDNSLQPAISGDGTHVAFTSLATNLVGTDENGKDLDVFVCKRSSGALDCVSRTFSGRIGGNGVSRKPQISGTGRYVVFESLASDLIAPGQDHNNQSDVFVRDLQTSKTVRINVSTAGVEAAGTSGYGAISADGRFVAFTSSARNLVLGDTTGGFLDFFVRDRDVSGNGVFDEPGDVRTQLLSQTPAGVQSNGKNGGNSDLSADGRFIVFMSEGNTLAALDQNGVDPDMACSPTCPFGRDVFRVTVY